MNAKHVHLIGIGGIGLSAIARVILSRGLRVSGSDNVQSPITEQLVGAGATVLNGHRAENIASDVDLVVITSAVSRGNPELKAANDRGIRVVKRREFLSELTEGYDTIAVAGSHGKTTTTAMIALILTDAGLDPVAVIGGIVPEFGSNARAGAGKYFVIEADEYDHAFLGLTPQIAVITNVDYDHPDIFPTRAGYRAAFAEFARQVRDDGKLIACGDDEGANNIASDMIGRSITYGFGEGNEWRPVGARPNREGGTDFQVVRSGQVLGDVSTRLPGPHNVANAVGALAAGDAVGVRLESMQRTLKTFGGVGRRFEIVGEWRGVTLVDDYAHHPSEIRATLAAARERYGIRELWAVFQPHTFSRTRALLDEFAGSFDMADHVVILEVYASREREDLGVSGRDILLKMEHKDARFIPSINEAASFVSNRLKPGSILITLGAGDVNRLSQMLMEA